MASTSSALQLLSTVSHLRYQQIAGQVSVRLKHQVEKPETFYAQAVREFEGCRWRPKCDFMAAGSTKNRLADLLHGRLNFLNSPQHIGWPPNWNCNTLPTLWLYNLHYFEYLWCLDYPESRRVVLDWMENYPLRQRQLGWDPYPTSLRLVNLCTVFFDKYRRQIEADTRFLKKLWRSIVLQAEWLSIHLERHLLGNHLLENGAALAVIGSCFAGALADKWLKTGMRILEEQICEQVLDDGMHFERSPMYHCRIMYLLTLLFNTGHASLAELVRMALCKMTSALRHLIHPDGGIALLNDSAFGIYPAPCELLSNVHRLLDEPSGRLMPGEVGSFALHIAGYYGSRSTDGTYIICDAAPIGPDYIPGHAHADLFSFELSLKGRRVIVDSGVHDYEIGPLRDYCRATRAHNTVEINGYDQCQMWKAFRVGRRGKPHDVKWFPGQNGEFQLSSWHDGYRRLQGKPVHYRQFLWDGSRQLEVVDKITASCSQQVVSRLHLHPDCSLDEMKDGVARICYPQGHFTVVYQGNGRLSADTSLYCPEFGIKHRNTVLVYTLSGRQLTTRFCITF